MTAGAVKVAVHRLRQRYRELLRFGREARALARLNHPPLVAVHDFGEAGGHFYLLMEFVDGANLRQLLQSGPLDPAMALNVIPRSAAARRRSITGPTSTRWASSSTRC